MDRRLRWRGSRGGRWDGGGGVTRLREVHSAVFSSFAVVLTLSLRVLSLHGFFGFQGPIAIAALLLPPLRMARRYLLKSPRGEYLAAEARILPV